MASQAGENKAMPRPYNHIKYSSRPDLQKESKQKSSNADNSPLKLRSSRARVQPFKIHNRINTIMNYKFFLNLESSGFNTKNCPNP